MNRIVICDTYNNAVATPGWTVFAAAKEHGVNQGFAQCFGENLAALEGAGCDADGDALKFCQVPDNGH